MTSLFGFSFLNKGWGRNGYDSDLMMYWFAYWLLLTDFILWLPLAFSAEIQYIYPTVILFEFYISEFSYKREKIILKYYFYVHSLFPKHWWFFIRRHIILHNLEHIGLDSGFNFVKPLRVLFLIVWILFKILISKSYIRFINRGIKNFYVNIFWYLRPWEIMCSLQNMSMLYGVFSVTILRLFFKHVL